MPPEMIGALDLHTAIAASDVATHEEPHNLGLQPAAAGEVQSAAAEAARWADNRKDRL